MNQPINIDTYPQLALLAWNRAVRVIPADEAFALYERNWRFVDIASLEPAEDRLIKELAEQYGRGILNV